jgi:predicted alpha/beta-hydrolase family hydrolase
VSGVPVRKSIKEIRTPVGMARAHVWRPPRPCGSLVLGHGAGGSSWSADLQALTTLAAQGWLVVLVEQPWRVAGRTVATPPAQLDVAWLAVMESLASGRRVLPRPLVVGGRSAGARVACRTAEAVGADAVLALSFPLHPPGKPEKSRAAEAQMVTVAGTRLAVIQGEKDPFGSPDDLRSALGGAAEVVSARGNHSFTRTPADVLEITRAFLSELLVPRDASSRVPPPELVGSPHQKGERQDQQHLP